jgi:hypothetical protein
MISNDQLASRCTSSPICGSERCENDLVAEPSVHEGSSSRFNHDIVESQSSGTLGEDENSHDDSTRWVVLSFICIIMASVAYSYDIPSALHRQFHDTMKLSELQINLLYTVYSVPNIVLPFVAGTLVD